MSVGLGRITAVLTFAALVQPHWSRALTRQSPEAGEANLQAYRIELLRAFPHEGRPFTQGLEISRDGHHLVETSGSYPPGTNSFIRLVDPATGKTLDTHTQGLESRFAEGLVQTNDGHWFTSTYLDKKLVEYDENFGHLYDHEYPGMGWGLTKTIDGSSFLATNGTDYVLTLNKGTLKVVDEKVVTCMGKRVSGLNELEMVDNFLGLGPTLLGNIYTTRLVLAVNPSTGQCTGVFSLHGLGATEMNEVRGFHVANGLAYNKTSGTLIATGKNWDQMFEVRVHPDATGEALPKLRRFLEESRAPPAPEKAVLFQVTSGGGGHSDHSSFLEARRLVGADGSPFFRN